MITQSIDTDPKAEKVLISLIRKTTPAKKLSQVRSLSQTMMQLSRRAIARANQEFDEQENELVTYLYKFPKDQDALDVLNQLLSHYVIQQQVQMQ